MRDDAPLIDFGGEQAVFEDLDELRASLPPAEGVPLAEGEIPRLARDFDPEAAERNAEILGVLAQESGHFLASPYGSAFAVGEDNQDVWGGLSGTEVGESHGVGGLGLVGTGRGGGGTGEGTIGLGDIGLIGAGGYGGRGHMRRDRVAEIDWSSDHEGYEGVAEHEFIATRDDDRSTFSIDVDTASYSNVRRILGEGRLPPAAAVRIEELINYFDYSDEPPTGDAPFSVYSEVATCPWAEDNLLVRVGLQGQMFNAEDLPTRNFVFLVDVSGSMEDRLPLLRQSLELLVDDLRPQDRVGIVVYAGASGVVLDPTKGDAKDEIRKALAKLQSGGSTNGGAGIELAYRLAQRHFVEGGANRVILATDGDFNVGVSSHAKLEQLIERKRESGVFLSVLGFGRGNMQDATMELLADKGNGNYAYIDSSDEAE
ncbi:MAG TPA: von Willebrand factor type A domain-containing protein, partial [Nannocystaceae bacterium]|nr:von Willebrand factor type A domain-containing protein [Nannocystaceae bacterium]